MTFKRFLVLLTTFASLATPALTQVIEKIPEVVIERETVLDEDGLKQWKPLEVKCPPCKGRGTHKCLGCDGVEMPGCTECDGKKTATCRTCAGNKVLPDPMEAMACPFCTGSGWYNCGQCGGFGSFGTTDQYGNENRLDCGGCKKKGRYVCTVCDGAGQLTSVRVKKKSPSQAKLKDILKTQATLAGALAYLEEFEPTERAAKVQKALAKELKKSSREFEPLKDMLELLDTVLAGIHKAGAGYTNYESKLDHQILVMKGRMVYLLRYQSRVLELCAERAEFNESVKSVR